MVVVVVQRDRDVLVREAGGVARGDKVLGQDWKKETSRTHTRRRRRRNRREEEQTRSSLG